MAGSGYIDRSPYESVQALREARRRDAARNAAALSYSRGELRDRPSLSGVYVSYAGQSRIDLKRIETEDYARSQTIYRKAQAGTVVLYPAAGQNIDGQPSKTLSAGSVLELMATPDGWRTLGGAGSGVGLLDHKRPDPPTADIDPNGTTARQSVDFVNITTQNANDIVQVCFKAHYRCNGSGNTPVVEVWIDDATFSGTVETDMVIKQNSSTNRANMSFCYDVESSLTVGLHRVEMALRNAALNAGLLKIQLAVYVWKKP